MIVQATTKEHRKDLIALTYKYHTQSIHKDRKIDPAKLNNIWNNPNFVLLVSYTNEKATGFLIGFKTECLYTDTTIAGELAWYGETPLERVRLFKSYEYWAEKIAKVDVIETGCIVGESPEKFYKRNGYKSILTMYQKVI